MAEVEVSGRLARGTSGCTPEMLVNLSQLTRMRGYCGPSTRRLRIVGVTSMLLGSAICASDLILLVSQPWSLAVAFSGVWSALAFGVMGGALALKAAARSAQVPYRFLKCCHCLYCSAVFVHLVPPLCALLTILWIHFKRNNVPFAVRDRTAFQTLTEANDFVRLAMSLILVLVDVILLRSVRYLMFFSSNQTRSQAFYLAVQPNNSQHADVQQSVNSEAFTTCPPSYDTVMRQRASE